MVYYVHALRTKNLFFAEIFLDARSIFQSCVKWKCHRCWNIFTESRSAYVRHVVDTLVNHKSDYHYDVKNWNFIFFKCLRYWGFIVVQLYLEKFQNSSQAINNSSIIITKINRLKVHSLQLRDAYFVQLG